MWKGDERVTLSVSALRYALRARKVIWVYAS